MKKIAVTMTITVTDSIAIEDLVQLERDLTDTAIESLDKLVYYDVPDGTDDGDIDDEDAVRVEAKLVP